jgi:hypothetical protein
MPIIWNQNTAFELSFNGIPFFADDAKAYRMPSKVSDYIGQERSPVQQQQPLENLVEELDRLLPFRYLDDYYEVASFPGRNLAGIARQTVDEYKLNPEIKIGEFFYPNGASRWSVFRGLMTSSQVRALIRTTQLPMTSGSYSTSGQRADSLGNVPGIFHIKALPLIFAPNTPQDALGAAPYSIITNMYMLPPRPLAEHGGNFDGLYLITLVDERFWWQFSPVSLMAPQFPHDAFDTLLARLTIGESSWQQILFSLAEALGIFLLLDPIDPAYVVPERDSPFWCNYENAAQLLDAVAANVGAVFVRKFNGTYILRSTTQSISTVQTNLAELGGIVTSGLQRLRTAGGDLFSPSGSALPVGDLTTARNFAIPASVTVTFPSYVYNDAPVPHFYNKRTMPPDATLWHQESFGGVWPLTVGIKSGGPYVSGLGGTGPQQSGWLISGVTGLPIDFSGGYSVVLRTTAKALFSGERACEPASGLTHLDVHPANESGLTALATALAVNYYTTQVAVALDEVFPGTFLWDPEGFHDLLYTYSPRQRLATTRVMRSQPWNQKVEEYQYGTPPFSGFGGTVKGVGGPLPAQSWTDKDRLSGTYAQGSGFCASGGSGLIFTTLANNYFSGTFTFIFVDEETEAIAVAAQDYFPTGNRWKGQILSNLYQDISLAIQYSATISGYCNSGVLVSGIDLGDPNIQSGYVIENLLFEGTSGGRNLVGGAQNPPFLSIYWRGIDGTKPFPIHHSGAILTMINPNTMYGANVVKHGKMQYSFPDDWTAGGAKAVHVVPQMQTVRVHSESGIYINNLRHYSGAVYAYDTAQRSRNMSGLFTSGISPVSGWQGLSGQVYGTDPHVSGLPKQEPCWIVERNNYPLTSGIYYDGQLVGYSAKFSGILASDESGGAVFPGTNTQVGSGNYVPGTAISGTAPVYLVNWDPPEVQMVRIVGPGDFGFLDAYVQKPKVDPVTGIWNGTDWVDVERILFQDANFTGG